jgi:hypothetical protein
MYRILTHQMVNSRADNLVPAFQSAPAALSDCGVALPQHVQSLVADLAADWVRDLAIRISHKYQAMNVGKGKWVKDLNVKPILKDDKTSLSQLGGAHACLVGLAQQAGMDHLQVELDVAEDAGKGNYYEIAGIASLVGGTAKRNTGKRLNAALKALAADLMLRLTNNERADRLSIQFIHLNAQQIKSPVDGQTAIPIAAYVIRFLDVEPKMVMKSLASSLADLSEAMGHEFREHTLVLSPAAVSEVF